MRAPRTALVSALVLWSLLFGCGPAAPSSPEGADADETLTQGSRALSGKRLRLMAGNLSSGNGQDYNQGSGIRIFQGTHPDVVLIQEFSYGADDEVALRGFVDQTFGTEYSYVRGLSTQIPNGVISRYPIIAGGDWNDTLATNREFTWARIDLPGPSDLWAVSVHLLTTGASNRINEANQLVKYLQANVPAGDFIVIGGDLNVGSRGESTLTSLSASVVTAGPYPADLKGNGNTNASRNKPYDWLMVSPGLSALAVPTVIGNNSFANGFVADTRVYSPIGDLAPALGNDSSAANMQHMGVVRDFALSDVDPMASVRVVAPNGGEVFQVGTTQTVRWVSSSIDTVDVSYTVDGTHFISIASSVLASTGSVTWSVPDSVSSASRIRVIDSTNSTDPTHADVSDSVFTIEVPPPTPVITVASPNGGESYDAGSSQTIRWSVSHVSGTVDIAYTPDGTTFTTLASGVSSTAGSVQWLVPSLATTRARVRVSDSATAKVVDLSDAAFSVTAAPKPPGQVLINEILANEPGSNTAGEFVELVNTGGASVDLSGWSVADSTMVRHTFAAGTTLAAGGTLVVFGALSAAPAGITAVGASTGTLGLSNSGDTVKLFNASSTTVDAFTYGSVLAANDAVSMNRSPDRVPGAGFVLHTNLSTALSSAGTTP